jgi:hypothetical protein
MAQYYPPSIIIKDMFPNFKKKMELKPPKEIASFYIPLSPAPQI